MWSQSQFTDAQKVGPTVGRQNHQSLATSRDEFRLLELPAILDDHRRRRAAALAADRLDLVDHIESARNLPEHCDVEDS
jgi:hypothetical protein